MINVPEGRLFTYFAKYYIDGGIGMRYVMDILIRRRKSPHMDVAYLESVLKKLYLDAACGLGGSAVFKSFAWTLIHQEIDGVMFMTREKIDHREAGLNFCF